MTYSITSIKDRRRWPLRPLTILSLIGILALTLPATRVGAQTGTGSIVGQVEDAESAIVPDAIVTITNVANNQSDAVKSDASGLYAVTTLPPGTYSVHVVKSGFEDVTVHGVSVNIASTSTVNVTLKVGSITTSVNVNAKAQMLDQSTPTFSTSVPEIISQNIPLPERSALEAVMLAPGVQGDPSNDMGTDSENPGIYTAPINPGGNFSVGGGRPGNSVELVDGVDLTMVGYPRVGITFSGDDLSQITVQATGLSSEYGRSGGGVINQASRSGTIQYHGKIGFRHEDPFFEATTFGQGLLQTQTGTTPITQDSRQNMFTGVLSGPVPIPYHRINKNTFFFVSYEPLRNDSNAWSRTRVPTPAELSGDFSNSYTLLNTTILSAQGYAAAVAAPRVGGLDYQFPLNSNGFPSGARYNTSAQYVPIPNYNLSAQLNQNAFAKFVLSQFPKPSANGVATPYVNFYDSNADYATDGTNAFGVRGEFDTDNRYNIRIDQNLGNADHAFFRFTDVPVDGTRYSFLGPNSPINQEPESVIDSKSAILDYTHIIRGNAVNDIHYSYTRMNYLFEPAPSTTSQDWAAKFGLTPSEVGAGFPSISIDTGGYGSSTGGNDGGVSLDEVYQFGDDYSVVLGRHNLKLGGGWRAMQLNRLPNTGIYGGSYSFSAGNTNNGSSGGNATASFILGSINGLTLSAVQEFYYRFKYFDAYAQDTWKVSPHLTLDLGLRYNLEYPRTEKYGLQGSFVPNLSGVVNGVAATGAFAFSGHNGLPATLYPVNYKAFEPRVGFAYLVTPKMTLRGSWGLIHAPMSGVSNSNIPALTPNSLSIGGALGGADPTSWVNYITNPVALPSTGIPGVLKPPSPFFSYGTGFLPWISQSNAVPYVETWSVSVQYQLSNSAMVQAAYVGNESHHLFSAPEETNLPPLNTLISEVQSGFNFNSSATTSEYGLGTGNANINLLPYPQFYNNPIESAYVRESSGNYNGLYLNGVESLSAGITAIGSFSWSKSMDDGSSGTEDGITTDPFGFTFPQTPYSKQGEYSLSTYDIPVHVTVGYNWDLPVGKGMLLSTANPILNAIFGGLHTSGMFNAESGYPLWAGLGTPGYFTSTLPICNGGNTVNCSKTLTYGSGGNAIADSGTHGDLGFFNLRPNIVPGVPLIVPNWRENPACNQAGTCPYLNPAAFTVPGSPGNPQLGDAPRTLGANTPRTIYFDMSGRKVIPLKGERVMLNLTADAINVFNHANLFVSQNNNHALSSTLNSTTGVYTLQSAFGYASGPNPGRTFAVGASVTF